MDYILGNLPAKRKKKQKHFLRKYERSGAMSLFHSFSLVVCALNILDTILEKEAIFFLKLRSILGMRNRLYVTSD